MKVSRIDVHALSAPLAEPFAWSQRWTEERSTTVVRVVADDGTEGWGETDQAEPVIALAPLVVGEDATRIERIWHRLDAALHQNHGFAGAGMGAVSAIDTALWDIAGKAAGRPVCALLGGPLRDSVAVYATGLYYRKGDFPDALSAEARGYAEAGFTGMKMKIGGLTVAEDVERVRHLRAVIGPEPRLMVDANEAYNAATASRVARSLADLDLAWFEEPCGSYDDEANLAVRLAAPMPISGAESLRSRHEFAPRLARRVFDIVQPDLVFAGGISEMLKIGHMAHAFGVQLHPHFWGTGISLAGTLHVAACLPLANPARVAEPYVNEPVVEYDRTPHGLRDALTGSLPVAEASRVPVPDAPGLGVQIDGSVLERFAARAPVTVDAPGGLSHGR